MIKGNSFGNRHKLIGSIEKSEVDVVVGGIEESSKLSIGLRASQLRNLGHGYGQFLVQVDDEDPIVVEVYNVWGIKTENLTDNEIFISKGLEKVFGVKIGQGIRLIRILDENGRIKYNCENQEDNPFGRGWEIIQQPIQGIIASIDDNGYNVELHRVGLSAMQMTNLGINRKSAPLNNRTLVEAVIKSNRGLLDGQDFGELIVGYNGKKASAQVYNAGGMLSIGGMRDKSFFNISRRFKLEIGR